MLLDKTHRESKGTAEHQEDKRDKDLLICIAAKRTRKFKGVVNRARGRVMKKTLWSKPWGNFETSRAAQNGHVERKVKVWLRRRRPV